MRSYLVSPNFTTNTDDVTITFPSVTHYKHAGFSSPHHIRWGTSRSPSVRRRFLHTHVGYDRSRFGDTPFFTVLHVPIRHRGVGRAMEDAFTNPHGPFFQRVKHGRSLLLHYVRLRRRRTERETYMQFKKEFTLNLRAAYTSRLTTFTYSTLPLLYSFHTCDTLALKYAHLILHIKGSGPTSPITNFLVSPFFEFQPGAFAHFWILGPTAPHFLILGPGA